MSPSFIVAIPARLGATRLPRKPLREIGGRPLIAHVIARAQAAGAAAVVVATDAEEIAAVARGCGVDVCMTRADHASGTDRLAEVAATRGWPGTAIVVNLQGDEPQAPASGVRTVAALLAQDPACEMATLAAPIDSAEQLFDPNCVKLVRDARGRALYFSRAPIPHARDAPARAPGVLAPGVGYLRHIGIYAYRAGFLRRFAALPRGVLESVEALEQLRALEHGHAIAVELAPEPFPAGVDTEQDLARVAAELASAPARLR